MQPTKIIQLILTDTSASNVLIRVTEATAQKVVQDWKDDLGFEIEGADGEYIVIDGEYVAGVSIRNDDLDQ